VFGKYGFLIYSVSVGRFSCNRSIVDEKESPSVVVRPCCVVRAVDSGSGVNGYGIE